MDLLLSAVGQTCTLVTMNYMIMRIGIRNGTLARDNFVIPLCAGCASILMMMMPFPNGTVVSDLGFIPTIITGLRFGLTSAAATAAFPLLYDLWVDSTPPLQHAPVLILSILFSLGRRPVANAGIEHDVVPASLGLWIGSGIFIYHLLFSLYRGMTAPLTLLELVGIHAFLVLLLTALIRMVNEEQRYWSILHSMQLKAHQDSLTRLPNYRSFSGIAERTMKTRPISILMIDIDYFKNYNDQLGHLRGDELLLQVGHLLQGLIGEKDYLARYGGEEFIIMCDSGNAEEVERLASRLCRAVAEHPFEGREVQPEGRVTISIGIALPLQKEETLFQMISRADFALYHSKHKGKNRYSFYHETTQAHSPADHGSSGGTGF
jgi:diguanylate cyclase